MSIFFNHNGKLYKEGSPVIGPASRGLRYGDGLFETMRSLNGNVEFLDEHLARLWSGLKLLQFEIPKHFTPELLENEITALLQKNGHLAEARIRLNLFRNDGGLYDAKDLRPSYVIESWELAPGSGQWNSNGLVLGICESVRKSCDILGNVKHNNYLPYVLAALQAKKEKWNDALLLNSHDRICDSTIANLFYFKDGSCYTSALSEAPVAGIIRKQMIGFLKQENISITEKEISVEELMNADELFLTNSIYKLRWVGQLQDRSYGCGMASKIYPGFLKYLQQA